MKVHPDRSLSLSLLSGCAQVQQEAEARLPAEPPEASASACRIAIRLPDGQRLQRRFDKLVDTVQVQSRGPKGCVWCIWTVGTEGEEKKATRLRESTQGGRRRVCAKERMAVREHTVGTRGTANEFEI